MAAGIVLPDIVSTFLVTTSSSFGESTVKKIVGLGLGEGEATETFLVADGATLFDDSYKKKTIPATKSPIKVAVTDIMIFSFLIDLPKKVLSERNDTIKEYACQENIAMIG